MNQRFLQGALLAFLGSMAFEATAGQLLGITLKYDEPSPSRGKMREEVKVRKIYAKDPSEEHGMSPFGQSAFLNLEENSSEPSDIKNLLLTLPQGKQFNVSVNKKIFPAGEMPENGEVIFTAREGGDVVNTFTYPYQISKIMADPKHIVGGITIKVSDHGLKFQKDF